MPDTLARRGPASQPPIGNVTTADAAVLLRAIERAAGAAEFDLGRLDHLTGLYERALAREAEAKFNAALARLQPKLPVLEERGEITGLDGAVQATYATWEDTVEAIRPLLARHGFSLAFRPGPAPAGCVGVVGILRHEAGHKEEAALQLPADLSGNKNPLQAVGSAVTYGQRYVAKMLLNLTSRGEDDDAEAAGKSQAEQGAMAEIERLPDKDAFLAWKRANRKVLGELPSAAFQRVIGHYGARLRRIEAAASGAG